MVTMNMLEAKTHLSKLVEAVETGAEDEVIIARHGRPVARLVPFSTSSGARLLGIAKGVFTFDKDIFDSGDEEIADMFGIPSLEELERP